MKVAKGFLLAAGFGKRLRPFTTKVAKPALDLFDKPLAAYSLDALAKAGVTEITVNLHHLGETIKERLVPHIPKGVSVTWSEEEKILGTGGALLPVVDLLADEDFYLINCDTYRDLDLADLAALHFESSAVATLALALAPKGAKAPIEVDEGGRIVRFLDAKAPGYKPGRGALFIGAHLFSPEVMEWVKKAGPPPFCINMAVNAKMVAAGLPLYGYLLDKGRWWTDAGTPERYLGAHFHFLREGQLPAGAGGRLVVKDETTPEGGKIIAPSWLGDGAAVLAGSVAGPYAILGEEALLAAGSSLEYSLLGREARGSDKVAESIVWQEVETKCPGVGLLDGDLSEDVK